MKALLFIFTLFTFLAYGFQDKAYGFQDGESKEKDQRYKYLKVFSDTLYLIEKSYVEEVSAEKLIQGSIKGMIRELDPYSSFLPAQEIKDFKTEVRGRFSGLGVAIEIKDEWPVVVSVLENSPADKKKIKSGDILVSINGKKTIGLNQSEVSKLLTSDRRGKLFNIVIKDSTSKNIRTVQIKSAMVSIPSVSYKGLEDNIIYVRIHRFTDRTLKEIKNIMDKHKKPLGMILDLRGNFGGVLDAAVQVADLFIKEGVIVSVKGRIKDYDKVFKAHPINTLMGFPILVLIDSYSASAAEVLAGALKENKRAVILGRTSFGKASVQSLIHVDKEHAVRLTVAHYYTPLGNSIHEHGIKPHIELKKTNTQSDEQLEDKKSNLSMEKDTDINKAVSFFKMFKHLHL